MIGDSWDADIVGAHNSRIDQIWFNPSGAGAVGFESNFYSEIVERDKKYSINARFVGIILSSQ